MRKTLVGTILVFLVAILSFHLVALNHFWYWKYWWFDNAIHFAGGFAIVLIVLLSGEKYFEWKVTRSLFFLSLGLGISLLTAIGWEIFEYKVGAMFVRGNYLIDTMFDVVMGFLGSVVGTFYALFIYKKHGL